MGLSNQEGGENMHRIQGKRQTQVSAGTPPQHCGRKRAHSDTEEGEKLNGSQPDCPPPRRRCTGCTETQKCTHGARGSGNLRSSSPSERNSPADGRSSGGETVHGLSGHRADSHPVWVGEQQLEKSSLDQHALPRVPVHPEAAGKKVKQKKKLKEKCGEED